MSSKKVVDVFRNIFQYTRVCNGFERVLKDIEITGGDVGHCVAEYEVKPESLNMDGTLHGGFIATIVDVVTTCAQMSMESGSPGVTVQLNVSYLRPAKEGDTIVIDAQTVKAGKSMAYFECELRNRTTGKLIAKGSHTKFIGAQKL